MITRAATVGALTLLLTFTVSGCEGTDDGGPTVRRVTGCDEWDWLRCRSPDRSDKKKLSELNERSSRPSQKSCRVNRFTKRCRGDD